MGWCTYGDGRRPQPWITLCLPRTESVDPVQVAKTLAHELAHSRGLRHRDMNTVRYGWLEGWREYYAWAASMPIEAEPPKPKPAPLDIVTRKYDHARTMTARAATKAKRAQTHLKKWTRRLRYFERRIAALRSADLHQGG